MKIVFMLHLPRKLLPAKTEKCKKFYDFLDEAKYAQKHPSKLEKSLNHTNLGKSKKNLVLQKKKQIVKSCNVKVKKWLKHLA